MEWHMNQVFVALLKFNGLNEKLSLINLNPVESGYYPLMIILDKSNRSCNVVDDLSTKVGAPSKTKNVIVKVFDMITRIYEVKTLIKHISCSSKWKFHSETCNLNKKLNNDKCQSEWNRSCTSKKHYSWNPSTCICENKRYLKSVADDAVTECDEILNFMDSASTNMTTSISSNALSTMSANVTNVKLTNVMSKCDKKLTINMTKTVPTNVKNTISTNFPITVRRSSDDKK